MFRKFSRHFSKQTLVEKIVQRYIVEKELCYSGDYVTIQPKHVMTHDNTSAVLQKFLQFPKAKIKNLRQPVFTLDHNVQDHSPDNLKKYQKIQDFAIKNGIDFYPAGRGIGHQIMCEEGYAWPLSLVVASDSHSNMYGGMGCLGTPVVRTDAAGIWATGTTWWQIPPISRVEFTGILQPGVTGKDVIITLCGVFNKDQVLNHVIEFGGPGMASLSVDDRLTIANMTTEWGTLGGVFEVDNTTFNWLNNKSNDKHPRINSKSIADLKANLFGADPDASYAKRITLDLSTVSPHVSGPDHVKKMSSVRDLEDKKIKVNKAYIVSCTNSRSSDLKEAANVLKGKKVATGVELYVSAASSVVQEECEKSGVWKTLVDAGAKTLIPGCGPCIGLGTGLLEDGEVGISASNRNFKGRMGSRNASAYLASPAVVAASAINGYISGPTKFQSIDVKTTIQEFPQPIRAKSIELRSGFPSVIKGQGVFCYQDNLNTDGIYPGKYTYNEAISKEEQANVAMENYDPEFKTLVQKGDILIGGFNFGTGSSREQAATCLKYKGIPCIIAGSFSETYKRNAINNGYLVIEIPQLVTEMKQRFGDKKLTLRTGEEVLIDFKKSSVQIGDKSYPMSPVGKIAQDLIMREGLENWILSLLKEK